MVFWQDYALWEKTQFESTLKAQCNAIGSQIKIVDVKAS